MGTTYHLTVVPDDGVLPEEGVHQELQTELDAILQAFNQIASTYIADSELSQLNAAPTGTWLPVGENLYDMLLIATEISVLSNGAFDITVGPLVSRWGFGPEARAAAPEEAEVAALLTQIGYQRLAIDFSAQQVQKQGDISLDLSAIAKGFAVDQVAAWLEYRGFSRYLVEIGGELKVAGASPRGGPWRLGVELPDALPGQVQRAVLVEAGAIATSGDYRNYYELDGKRLSHTIDPRSGYPVEHKLASVTVLADTAAEADAWATAFSVLGPERGLTLANELSLAAYFLSRGELGDFTVTMSDAFAREYGPAQ